MINFSELLWKSGRTKDPGLRTGLVAESEGIQVVSAIQHTPVEKAHLEPGSRLALLADPRSANADRFRFLRIRLRELRELARLRSLVITSPLPGDGKTTTAMNLAMALAEGGNQAVLVIEADLHHPNLANSLGLRPRSGLAECLEDGLDPMSQVRKVEPLGWYLLQAGQPRGNPTELLQSEALSTVMERVSAHFDWVLLDTPPVLPLTDSRSLARQVDATLLVARAGRTPSEAIEEAVNLIGQKRVIGIVLNAAEGLNRLYSGYNKYYK